MLKISKKTQDMFYELFITIGIVAIITYILYY